MDRDSIDRIRSATFPTGRRGYEKREVDRFLTRLADWLETGGGDQARIELVRRELERVGETTAKVLTEAHHAAEELRAEAGSEARTLREAAAAEAEEARAEADRYASGIRGEVDAYSERTRIEADQYSSETRTGADADAARARQEAETEVARVRREADDYAARIVEKAEQDAENKIAAAETKARSLVDEGNRRREEAEDVIRELEGRRDTVIADMERLSSELTGSATQHRHDPGESAGDGEVAEPHAARQATSTRNGS